MISVNRRMYYGEVFNDVRCLSTDEKPTNVKNGSILTEIDTGKRFLFDASGIQWHEVQSGSGGAEIDLGITGASVGQVAKVAAVDADGAPTAWASGATYELTAQDKADIAEMVEADIHRTLIVTCVTQDGVAVTGQTVYLRDDDASGAVLDSKAYEGQPVSFDVVLGQVIHVSVSNTLAYHFNPTTATVAVGATDIAVTLTYSDLSHVQTAADIQDALDVGFDLTNLLGESITCTRGNDTLEWDVVDYDATAGEVTLAMHDCSAANQNLVFEPPQALAWFESGLAAGSYKFKSGSTYYYLTLGTGIPAGGQLRATTTTYQSYESQSAAATLEAGTVSTTEISGATDLGTCGTDTGAYALNHMDRVNYGSSNFGESAMLWWLNTDAAAGTLRTPVTRFSRAHSYVVAGFLAGLDADFLACVAPTTWECGANTTYECPAELGGIVTKNNPYTVRAKFGLLSEREVSGSYFGVDAGDSLLDLYVGATANDRKKYRGSSAQYWWLRSSLSSYANYVKYVDTSGAVNYQTANYACGVVPACKIRKSQTA